jgi:deoxyribose-phosphate aldolase
MDQKMNDLIEKITREVVSSLSNKSLATVPLTSSGRKPKIDIKLASMIDHTILKPEASSDEIRQLCSEAKEYGFASVCINSSNVILAAECLKGSSVPVCACIGFPLGASTTKAKAYEAMEAVENGAREIDMVINVGALKSRDYGKVKKDIQEVVIASKPKAIVKVIIEACLLTEDEKEKACELAKEAKADFVKTSTGFNKSGATAEDVRLMRRVVGPGMGIKAAGGIRDYQTAMKLLEAGACSLGMSDSCRIGASSSISIVSDSK